MKKELITHQDPKSPISEIFRTLRTNIQFMNTKGKLKTLLVASTLPGEGKSWVSANLAVTFAQAGKKVVLVDADMRKGRQYTVFGVSPVPGLSNYLSGIGPNNEELSSDLSLYLQPTNIGNLYLMPAGNVPPNPSELLVSENMVYLLEQLKQITDIVIIDGTPNELVTDSLILARLADSTIIVTASGYTKKDSLQRIITNIKNVGGKIAGVVLNKVPTSSKKYEESYYYGSTSLRNVEPRHTTRTRNNNERTNRENTPNTRKNSEVREPKTVNRQSEINKKKSKRKQYTSKADNVMTRRVHDSMQSKTKKTESNSNTLNNSNLNFKSKEEVSMDKTNDILKQINEYLDNEKKNLK